MGSRSSKITRSSPPPMVSGVLPPPPRSPPLRPDEESHLPRRPATARRTRLVRRHNTTFDEDWSPTGPVLPEGRTAATTTVECPRSESVDESEALQLPIRPALFASAAGAYKNMASRSTDEHSLAAPPPSLMSGRRTFRGSSIASPSVLQLERSYDRSSEHFYSIDENTPQGTIRDQPSARSDGSMRRRGASLLDKTNSPAPSRGPRQRSTLEVSPPPRLTDETNRSTLTPSIPSPLFERKRRPPRHTRANQTSSDSLFTPSIRSSNLTHRPVRHPTKRSVTSPPLSIVSTQYVSMPCMSSASDPEITHTSLGGTLESSNKPCPVYSHHAPYGYLAPWYPHSAKKRRDLYFTSSSGWEVSSLPRRGREFWRFYINRETPQYLSAESEEAYPGEEKIYPRDARFSEASATSQLNPHEPPLPAHDLPPRQRAPKSPPTINEPTDIPETPTPDHAPPPPNATRLSLLDLCNSLLDLRFRLPTFFPSLRDQLLEPLPPPPRPRVPSPPQEYTNHRFYNGGPIPHISRGRKDWLYQQAQYVAMNPFTEQSTTCCCGWLVSEVVQGGCMQGCVEGCCGS